MNRLSAFAAFGTVLVITAGSARADCKFPNSVQEIQSCVDASHAKLRERFDSDLAAYAKDSSNGCSNPSLQAAGEIAVGYDEGTRSYGQPDLDEGMFAGGLLLDAADAAQARGCPTWAETIYRAVIRRYVGSGYEALRERAILGLTHPVADSVAPPQAPAKAGKRKAPARP